MKKACVIGWPIGVAIWFGAVCGLVSVVSPPGRWRYAALTGALILSETQRRLGVPFEVARGGLREGAAFTALAALAAA